MVLTVDFDQNDHVTEWRLTPDGVSKTTHTAYTPTLFVGDAVTNLYGRHGGPAPNPPERAGLSSDLDDLRAFLDGQDAVAALDVGSHRQTFRTDPRPLLRIDATDIESVRPIAKRVRQFGHPDQYTCYNVDLTRELRYCLETRTPTGPDRDVRELRTLHFELPTHESGIDALSELTVDGDHVESTPQTVVEAVADTVTERDPDVLVVSTADLIPLLFDAATQSDVQLDLGREPGYTKLAGESTYTSYGQIGHSPARYTVPGRVIIDESNTFFYHESGLAGCLDLVQRSGLPLQELGWASIGRVLTAMQIRESRSRDVLVPWHAWRPEFFKTAATLDDADRGGTTLAPSVGVHENAHELDFASLYPNIIRTRNISPETVQCGCCNNTTVPGLDYTICENDGYLPDVLGPLIDARTSIKSKLAACDDPDERERLEAASAAIKWILVSCFGYQGFSNAKYGRIECHEAINAYARKILLNAKTALEDAGWRVLHGIVDSLWVAPAPDRDQRPLDDIAAEITADTGIELEYECEFDWVAFCPMRNSDSGALTRYFGKRRGEPLPETEAELGDAIKTRGIEGRQRSTCTWVSNVQSEALRVFDETRSPEAVCAVLQHRLSELHAGTVARDALVVTTQVSKNLADYTMETLPVAALRRAQSQRSGVEPGQTVPYIVVNADARGAARIRLPFEDDDRYDTSWYETQAIRAIKSILSPVGWCERDIRDYLAESSNTSLRAYK